MNKKILGIVLSASLLFASSVSCVAGDRHDSRDSRNDSHSYRSYHGYTDRGSHYGYYRNTRGEVVFGLIGLGIAAAIIANTEKPIIVQRPVYVEKSQVVYVQQPAVVIPQVVQQVQVVQVETPQPTIVTVNVQNSNGSFTPVTLHRIGSQWVGPRGEVYENMPTIGQLRPVYGF